jgi:hypothetical protein
MTRRTLFTLALIPQPKIIKPATRNPDLAVFVLDDTRHQAEMAEVQIWLDQGYTLKDVVRQMAIDLQVCGGKQKA